MSSETSLLDKIFSPKGKQSSRHQIAIKSIDKDIVELENSEYRIILQVGSINFPLKSEEEKDLIIRQYEAFLNSVDYEFQILQRVRLIDLDGYVKGYEEKGEEAEDGVIRSQLYGYADFVGKLIDDYRVLSRDFYIVLSYKPNGREKLAVTQERIRSRSASFQQGLSNVGISCRQLNTLEIANLFFECYNETEARTTKLSDHLLAEMHKNLSEVKKTQKLKRFSTKKSETKKIESMKIQKADLVDVLTYAGMENARDHIKINDKVKRTYAFTSYPHTAETGWLDVLNGLNSDVDISIYHEATNPAHALKTLQRNITEMQSQYREKVEKGVIVGAETTDPIDSASELRDALRRGQQKLFLTSIYFTLTADTMEDLEEMSSYVKQELSARLFVVKSVDFQQVEGFQSTLPRCQNLLKQKRSLDSTTSALTFPFVSSDLVEEKGILYGVNLLNSSLVFVDRYSLTNANSITFAQSGSGKSYASKVEIMRQLMNGTDVIVIDPEREYRDLTESINGTYINLSANSSHNINPFDLTTTEHTKKDIAGHVQILTDVISLMVDGLEKDEKAVLDKAIIRTYDEVDSSRQPVLDDLLVQLRYYKATSLVDRLERYTIGSLADVFNKPTNIDLTNRLVVFDINELENNTREVMMLIVANYIDNIVRRKKKQRLLVIDEAWIMLQHEETALFLSRLTRRARKYFLGVAVISQQATDFLNNEYGQTIASQSAMRFLMKQDSTTITGVAEHFKLSDTEKSHLEQCAKGDVLIIADNQHVLAHVEASEVEHPLITTDPHEKIASEEEKAENVG